MRYKYNSLEDFLISNRLTVDGTLDDGWGAQFAVKGREVEVAILFADIAGFSRRTEDLSPTETLIFVNNFFAWITAEAIKHHPCIVDKYIGDEVMVLFSKEFGSEDPFVDALQTARWIAEKDALSFGPHIGIAAGLVIVGFVGTPVKYDCSVFGLPVTIASRCAEIKPDESHSASIIFPSKLWEGYVFEEVFTPEKIQMPDGRVEEQHNAWKMCNKRQVPIKNMGLLEVREIIKTSLWFPSQSADKRAKAGMKALKAQGLYRGKTELPNKSLYSN